MKKARATNAHLQTWIILQQPEDIYDWRAVETFRNCRYRKVIILPLPSMTIASLHTVGHGCHVPLLRRTERPPMIPRASRTHTLTLVFS